MPPPPPPPVPAPVPEPPAFDDPLEFLPADTGMWMQIDVAAFRRTEAWASAHRFLALIAPSFEACGYDPLADLDSITGLDRAKTLACLNHPGPVDTRVTTDGEFVTLNHKRGAINMFTFVNATTLVMQGSKHPTRASLAQVLTTGAPLRHDRGFLAQQRALEPDAGVSLMILPGSKFLHGTGAAHAVHSTGGTIRFTDGLTAVMHVKATDAPQAANRVAALQPRIEEARSSFDQLEAVAAGDAITMTLQVSSTQLAIIAEQVQAAVLAGEDTPAE
jgi:hypothetical protein